MTADISDFIRWLQALPLGKIEIESVLTGGAINTAKRVVCVREKPCGDMRIIVNPMGSHFTNEFYADNEVVSTFQP